MVKRLLLLFRIFVGILFTATQLAHKYYWDVSQNSINSLTTASQDLLNRLDDDLQIKLSTPDVNVINAFNAVLQSYTKFSPRVKVEFNRRTINESITISYKKVTQNFALDLNNV